MLDTLEIKWRSLVHGCAPPECTGEVQFFAWDENENGVGEVICVGSNYTQYPQKSHLSTRTTLRRLWWSNYDHAVNLINTAWQSEWRQHSWLVGNGPLVAPRFFVMTNLVPWITSRPWTSLSECSTRAMIETFYRRFRHAHLIDLKTMFPKAFVVGHGIDDKTLPYLPAAITLWSDRMIWANLTYRKTPKAWDARIQRFRFT